MADFLVLDNNYIFYIYNKCVVIRPNALLKGCCYYENHLSTNIVFTYDVLRGIFANELIFIDYKDEVLQNLTIKLLTQSLISDSNQSATILFQDQNKDQSITQRIITPTLMKYMLKLCEINKNGSIPYSINSVDSILSPLRIPDSVISHYDYSTIPF